MNNTRDKMLERLVNGETIYNYSERGQSMTPLIKSRQPADLSPVNVELLEKDDIVWAKVDDQFYMHLITAVKDDQVLISNNHGYDNGWTHRSNVFAIVSAVDGIPLSSAIPKIKIMIPGTLSKEYVDDVRPVNIAPEDGEEAIGKMKDAGVRILT